MEVSHGCIRLYPRDIERLFNKVKIGTPGMFVYQPVKFGWRGDLLYVEVHDLIIWLIRRAVGIRAQGSRPAGNYRPSRYAEAGKGCGTEKRRPDLRDAGTAPGSAS